MGFRWVDAPALQSSLAGYPTVRVLNGGLQKPGRDALSPEGFATKKQTTLQTGWSSIRLKIRERSRTGYLSRGATAHQPIGRPPA